MKPVLIMQEILLMTTATFSGKEFCEMRSQEGNRYMTAAEQLEEACWNGLVNELLPELMQKPAGNKKIFLWQVEARASYLRMSLGACFPDLENIQALDPYIFLSFCAMN